CVGDLGVGPGVEAGGGDLEAGGVVRFTGVDHVVTGPVERSGELVFGLRVTLGDVDEAPERGLLAEPLLDGVVQTALGEAGVVQRKGVGGAGDGGGGHQ